MPLTVPDFVADTMEMNAKEVGAYMLLLMSLWQRKGYLPNDHSKLKRVARIGRDWPTVWASLERHFEVEGDTVYNEKLLAIVTTVAHQRAVNAHSGARGGRAKALKEKKTRLANATISPTVSAWQLEPEPYKNSISKEIHVISDTKIAVEIYNSKAKETGWPQVQKITKPRRAKLAARLKEVDGIDGWRVAIEKASASDFLTGKTPRPFFASFDWIVTPANFTKIMEGNYGNRNSNSTDPDPEVNPFDVAATMRRSSDATFN